MSLLHDLINESAAGGATGAGSIAGGRARLFGGPEVDQDKENLRKTTMLRRIGWKIIDQPNNQKSINSTLRWREIAESAFEDEFDASDVISKLDAAEKKSQVNDNTVCFGMEDETGAIVKVYVRDEQAEDFEHALATMLGGADEDANDENSHSEIAEVLYQLKDKFEIVDVDWGVIQGDEEEEQELEGGEEGAEGAEGAEGEDAAMGGEGGEEGMDDMADPGEAGAMDSGNEEAKSALQDVIDVMKADAEARKAEADAKKAEADAKIGKHAVEAAEAKVKQEEEILDMETHEKAQKTAEKEAKTLAKLAKYRHEVRGNGTVDDVEADVDVDADADVELNMEENEEMQGASGVDDEISKEDLADLIYKHLRANQN